MIRGYDFDQKIKSELESYSKTTQSVTLAGVDEVGRGPLAGPVVACAVILPESPLLENLNDSKALSEKNRVECAIRIRETALACEIAIVENQIVDTINVLAASLMAMRQAVAKLTLKPTVVLVDGNQKPKTPYPERAIIKGDTLSASIMAASIVAKVTRDKIMVDAHKKYPMYGFDTHKGYGAKTHIEAIEKYGPCPLHRLTFEPLRRLLNQDNILL